MPELTFARFLWGLNANRRGHLGSDVGIFLKKNRILPDGMSATSWVNKRRFMFRIVHIAQSNYVELQQPAPDESRDAFLDKVCADSS